jgi:hypothetical protein
MKTIQMSVLLGAILSFSTLNANAVQSINVQTFNPSTSDHFVILEDGYKSEWPKTSKYYFGANYNYLSDPLVVLDATQSTKAYDIITSIQTLDLYFGMKVANNFAAYFGAPVHMVSFADAYPPGAIAFPKGSKFALGDMKIMGKIRMTNDTSNTNISLIPEIHLPTGATEYFVSDASPYLAFRAALERQFTDWTLLVNIGFAAAQNSIYSDSVFTSAIDYRKRLITGVGALFPFNDQWALNVELNSINMIPFDKNVNPNDAYAGLRYAFNDGLVVTGGASVGRIGGAQGQEFRAIAGVRWNVFEKDAQAPQPLQASPAKK